MSNKKKLLILFLLGAVSIITGLILLFISNLKKDQKEMNDRISVIIKQYDEFSSEIEKVNATREELHKDFLDTIYYDTFEKNDTSY